MKYKTELVYPIYDALIKLKTDYNNLLEGLDTEEKKEQATPFLSEARPFFYSMFEDYNKYIALVEKYNQLNSEDAKKAANADELKKARKQIKQMIREHEDELYIKYSIKPKSLLRRIALKRKTGNKLFGSLKGKVNETKEEVKGFFPKLKEAFRRGINAGKEEYQAQKELRK